jgi:hypothetical protein
MSAASDAMWDEMIEASNAFVETLGLDQEAFTPKSLAAVDRWVAQHKGKLSDDEVTQLGLFLARVLCAEHSGGLTRIQKKKHPLDGEWAVTGFSRGLANDYHVPFMVSAVRIGIDRSLTARQWYDELVREGR